MMSTYKFVGRLREVIPSGSHRFSQWASGSPQIRAEKSEERKDMDDGDEMLNTLKYNT
ncbi:hypothetical protein GCM10007920_37440 [Ciceribacter naphthalenivorans]|uniref:Uncharacterized protein n=1 Tax=Sphingomonas psychrolutea TaxID=1259676 RepID=A0ABQ6EG58_9SPHN|nr:hypothetical protein GCM10007920_37440 [Ciceribacter naphthalenivorans]GLT06806.1 hypothetical protein GCM10007926_37440 [Sphingomonas psychrolutea]